MRDMILLIEPLIPGLRRYARALLRDATAADDLVQDCLERAIGRWSQRRQDCDVRPWLFAILHNLAVNRLKQKARRGPHVPIEDVDDSLLARAAAQEQPLHEADILRALSRLPEDQRAVLLLVSVEELSYAEAASALDIPIGTVMSRLSRARDRLHRVLQEGDQPVVTHLRSVK